MTTASQLMVQTKFFSSQMSAMPLASALPGISQVARPTARALMVDDQVVMVSASVDESIAETASVLGDNDAMTAFRQGVADLDADRVVSWDDLKRELGL